MAALTALQLVFPEENERDKASHLSTIHTDPKIFSILDNYLQPLLSTSVEETAKEIIKLYPEDPDSNVPGPQDKKSHFLFQLWTLVVVAIEQIPWQHPSQEKVIKLLKVIRDQPNPVTISFENMAPFKDFVLWTDLPILRFVLTDNMNTHGVNITDNSDKQKATRIRDLNFQGFATLLTLSQIHDFTNLAVYRIRDALEVDPDYDYEWFSDFGALFNVGLPPAEIWITRCAKLLYRLSKANGEGALQNNMVGGKHWKGRKGFSLGRWNFWKERLYVIASSEQASEQTRLTARYMKVCMIAAEEDSEEG